MPIQPIPPSQVQPQDIDYASLVQTLSPLMGLMGLSQAQSQQDQDQIHAQVQQAQQAAQGAQQQYAQAAAQPQPQSGPTNFWDQLAGNTASVLGRNPDYGREAFQRGQQQDEDLRKSRAENLAALKATYEAQAHNAERLGNTEMASTLRGKVEQVSKNLAGLIQTGMKGTQQTAGEGQKQAGRMELQGEKGQQAMDLEKLRQQGRESLAKFRESLSATVSSDAAARFDAAAKITWNGKKIVDIDMFGGKSKDAVMQWATENDAVPVKHDQMKVLEDVQGARANTEKIMDGIGPYLSKTPMERYSVGLKNRFARVFQENAELGSYRTWRGSAIRALRAAAGSGGLRLNQAEIDLAVKNDIPDEMDTYDTAQGKLAALTDMLDSAEDPLTSRDWRALTPSGGVRRPGFVPPATGSKADPLGILK